MISRRGLFGILAGAMAAGFAPLAKLVRRPKPLECDIVLDVVSIGQCDGFRKYAVRYRIQNRSTGAIEASGLCGYSKINDPWLPEYDGTASGPSGS